MLVAAWALFAFAGAYRWTVVPIVAGAATLVAIVRPFAFRHPHRTLDAALVVCLIVIALQLIPLPSDLRQALSPSAARVENVLLIRPVDTLNPPARPLSLDPQSTAWALVFGTALLLIFWSARATFTRGGGLRFTCRSIGWIGLALAAIMFVQRAVTPDLIYGFWQPITRASHPTPLGPFVNRNDIATWLMMAIPTVFGYILARVESKRHGTGAVFGIESLLDARMWWLCASLLLMTGALLASLSRSGLFGGAAALLTFAVAVRRRLPGGRVAGMLLAAAGVIAAIGGMYANVPALMERISATVPSDLGGRLTVWRETWPMARDFPWTGIGVGAFERGMLVYQQSTRLIFFNHAHDEYLQVLVEGGMLLVVPAGIALLAAAWGIQRRLAVDRTSVFWIRAGAASAIAAVAAQSVWDTGLRMPPNAVLFAIASAVALHGSEPMPFFHDDPRRRNHERNGEDSISVR